MLNSIIKIKEAISKIGKSIDEIEENDYEESEYFELPIVKNKIIGCWADIVSGIHELKAVHESAGRSVPEFLMRAQIYSETTTPGLIGAKDFSMLVNSIRMVYDILCEEDVFVGVEQYASGHNAEHTFHDLPANEEFIRMFAESLKSEEGKPVNVLDINAGNGSFINFFKNYYSGPNNVYGVFSGDGYYNMDYRNMCARSMVCSVKDMHIQNGSFDVVVCSPNVDAIRKDINPLKRTERVMITKAYEYLNRNGVMFISLPVSSLRADLCVWISKNLKNIQIRIDDENILRIVGRKNVEPGKESDNKILNLLRLFILRTAKQRQNFLMENPLEEYALKPCEYEIKTFRGGTLDDDEMERIFADSAAQKEFLHKRNKSNRIQKKNPLLPFSIGQIGLVLTSGCLDGIVTDKDGNAHVVKGRVVKQEEEKETVDTEHNKITVSTIKANRVQIEVMLPDGTYRKLA